MSAPFPSNKPNDKKKVSEDYTLWSIQLSWPSAYWIELLELPTRIIFLNCELQILRSVVLKINLKFSVELVGNECMILCTKATLPV